MIKKNLFFLVYDPSQLIKKTVEKLFCYGSTLITTFNVTRIIVRQTERIVLVFLPEIKW